MNLEISQDKILQLIEQNTSLQVGIGILFGVVIFLVGLSIFLIFMLENKNN